MTEEQKYLFDLQGYIVLEDVVPKSVVEACNKALDPLEDMPPEDYPPPLCLGTPKTEQELYISNILETGPVFNPLTDLPEVLDVIEGVTGGPYRLNHTYTIYRWGGGYTGMHMNGTPIIPKCQYHCRNGQMVSTLTKAVFPLLDWRCRGRLLRCHSGGAQEQLYQTLGQSPRRKSGVDAYPRQGGRRHYFYRGLNTRFSSEHLETSTPNPLLLLQYRLHARLGRSELNL